MKQRFPSFHKIYRNTATSMLPERMFVPLMLLTSLTAGLFFFTVLVLKGYFMIDGSFYIYAPWAVTHSKLLYKDFFFGQPPLFAYIYGYGQKILHLGYGIIPTRIFASLIGFITIILAFFISCWIGQSRKAGYFTLLVLLTDVEMIRDFSCEKLYPLASFFLTLSLFFYFIPIRISRMSRYAIVLSCLALTFGTRFFAISGYIWGLFFILFVEKNLSFHKKLVAITVSLFILMIIFVPPYFYAGKDLFHYNLWGFHSNTVGRGLFAIIKSKISIPIQAFRHHWLLVLCSLLLIFANKSLIKEQLIKLNFGFGLLLMILLTHFISHWVTLDYQSYLIPGFCALVIPLAYKTLSHSLKKPIKMIIGYSLIIIAPFYGLGNIQVFFSGEAPDIKIIRQAGRELKQLTNPSEKIMIFNGAVLVEADRPTIPGAESLPFSYQHFLPDSLCLKYRLLNKRLFYHALDNKEFAALALTKGTFSLLLPVAIPAPPEVEKEIWERINRNYSIVKRIPFTKLDNEEVLIYLPKRR
ncbi:MAG: hypothetical protein JXA60_09910 [Candidatus Coatesbacteria bacterium]|nr:hypothetical protein [Candidatus Coatesbacteria bacterium]